MQGMLTLDEKTFPSAIAQGVTLVDFWAPWCGPCKMQIPILEKVADQLGAKAKVAKVNVDDAGAVAAHYGIRSIPTLIVFKDGEAVQQFVGVQSEVALVSAVEAAL